MTMEYVIAVYSNRVEKGLGQIIASSHGIWDTIEIARIPADNTMGAFNDEINFLFVF
jgi:hypothetical protein